MVACAYCQTPFDQYRAGDRFCSRDCSKAWHSEQRRQAVEFFKKSKMPVETPASRDLKAAE